MVKYISHFFLSCIIDSDKEPVAATTEATTEESFTYQRRPFDEWEEDPESTWHPVIEVSANDKIFGEDVPTVNAATVKVRTGGTFFSKKTNELENTKVVIQRSSQLSSSGCTFPSSPSLILFILVVVGAYAEN